MNHNDQADPNNASSPTPKHTKTTKTTIPHADRQQATRPALADRPKRSAEAGRHHDLDPTRKRPPVAGDGRAYKADRLRLINEALDLSRDGMSTRQIAQRIGCAVSTANKLLQDALADLEAQQPARRESIRAQILDRMDDSRAAVLQIARAEPGRATNADRIAAHRTLLRIEEARARLTGASESKGPLGELADWLQELAQRRLDPNTESQADDGRPAIPLQMHRRSIAETRADQRAAARLPPPIDVQTFDYADAQQNDHEHQPNEHAHQLDGHTESAEPMQAPREQPRNTPVSEQLQAPAGETSSIKPQQ